MSKNIYTAQFVTRVEEQSDIRQTVDNINLSVDRKLLSYSTTTEMNAQIDLKASEITSSVSETYATKTTTNTLSSRISQTAKSIALTVDNGSTSSGITITTTKEDGSTATASGTIQMNGLVTFTNLSTSGQTTINGSNITTGTIQSSNYVSGTSGTKIQLSNGVIDSKNFKINSSGNVTVNGTITSSNVNLTGGTIQSNNYVSGTSGTKINLSNGSIDSKNFKLSSSGNVTISGNITATSGTIGGCTIRDGTLYIDNININSVNGSKIDENSMAGNRLTNNSIENQKLYSVSPSKFISGTATRGNVDSFILETNVGYLKCGNGVSHPYVSALNVAYGGGGLSFRNGTVVGNVGSEIGNIQMDTSSGENVMRFTSAGGQNFQNGTLKIIPNSKIIAPAFDAGSIWIGNHVINHVKSGVSTLAQISMDYNLDLWSDGGYHVRANGVQVGGDNSTLNIKQNVKERDTSNVLDILKEIKLYDYNYIPEVYGGEKSYGYIIDYLERIPDFDKYVHFVDINRDKEHPTKVVENQEQWIKFLLACVIELQKKINKEEK